MDLWLKTRRLPVLLAGLALYVCLALAAGDMLVSLPSLDGGAGRPLIVFAPLLVCAGLAYSLSSRMPGAEAAAGRPVARFDRWLVVAAGVAAIASAHLVALVVDAPNADTAGRNAAFLIGLMLCARRTAGDHAAALVPAAWVITMTLIGGGGPGRDRAWTVILMPADHVGAAVAAAVVFASGLMAVRVRPGRGGTQ
ncbi:hypothetical protein [Streptomyces sp. RKAG290]|uniref:hypothetical protein n=1 Tax=Streptomyces sp. RKAG290 TaxID=2888348 RepID=UPI00203388EF|nr:hypothetical protein [Streptomyces sp. RKAG290]MCM2412589.1 hypothetical protein [Streptomyces sp. RKAG290]